MVSAIELLAEAKPIQDGRPVPNEVQNNEAQNEELNKEENTVQANEKNLNGALTENVVDEE
ncbi:MAG: hypothetical protein NZZ41_08090, partial [Candidatus Dojkabacteria bacterium]|nr:hypothetical protein [Candidatus Dojkabacteria bacterium]